MAKEEWVMPIMAVVPVPTTNSIGQTGRATPTKYRKWDLPLRLKSKPAVKRCNNREAPYPHERVGFALGDASVGSGVLAKVAEKLERMPKMGLFTALFDRTHSRRIAEIAQHIAQRCSPTVWNQAHQRALAMAPAEARGYLRAHAGLVLSGEVTATLSNRRIPASLHAQIAEAARDALVETLLREVVRVQKTTTHRRLAA